MFVAGGVDVVTVANTVIAAMGTTGSVCKFEGMPDSGAVLCVCLAPACLVARCVMFAYAVQTPRTDALHTYVLILPQV